MKSVTVIVIVAILITLGSVTLQRRGPDYQLACSMGRSANGTDITCSRPVLSGGWPAPFLFDSVGVSVEGKLSFIEDDTRWEPLLATGSFWLLVSALAAFTVRKLAQVYRSKSQG